MPSTRGVDTQESLPGNVGFFLRRPAHCRASFLLFLMSFLRLSFRRFTTVRLPTHNSADGVALSRLLAVEGICSRREAKSFIELGHVKVDGIIVTDGSVLVPEGAAVELTKRALDVQANKATIILHKPLHYASCQAEMYHKPSTRRLLTPAQRWEACPTNHDPRQLRKLLIAGRLDSDCSGLLVYTQDGRIAKAISDRYSSIPMEYEVALKAPCTDDQMSMLSQGMLIDGKQVEGCEAARMNDNDDKLLRIKVCIRSQVLSRQLQRMLAQCGVPFMYLHRVRVGNVQLGELPVGRWRTLGQNESF